ncbi:hypothetical protein ACTFIZ_011882 [Dictyostelium cf. discoideum]
MNNISKIYYLNKESPNQRSNDNLRNIENSENNKQISEDQLIKIIPMIGDISKDKFGLTEQDYLKLSNDDEIFEETNILPNFDTTPIGYIRSKVISEKLLTNAAESRGIPSIIIRPPDIFSNPITGIGHSNDILSLLLKASKEIGYYPNIRISILTTPLTTIAKTTIDLIFNENSWNQNNSKPISIYSLNGNSIEINLFYELLENNFNCKGIDYQEWIELVSKSNGKSSKRYSTFHIHGNQNLMISNYKINSLFKMSKSTKELLISIGSYNHQDWEINESIILNDINNNNN